MSTTRKITIVVLAVLLSAFHIAAEAAVINDLAIYNTVATIINHLIICLISGFAFFILVSFGFKFTPGKRAGFILGSAIGQFLCWALLIGSHKFTAAIAINSVIMVAYCVASGISFGGKKAALAGVAATIIIATIGLCFYYSDAIEKLQRRESTPLTEAGSDTLLPHAKEAKKIYTYTWESADTANFVFLQTVQGYMSLTSDEQIYLQCGRPSESNQLETMQKYYDVEIIEVESKDELLDLVAPKIKNYVLCDSTDMESITVGVTLCNQMDAVLVPESQLPYAQKYGWNEVFNTIGKDKYWLMESKYFDNLNKDLMIVCTQWISNETHCDYALLANAWFVTQFNTVEEYASYCEQMNRGFYSWAVRYNDETRYKEITENACVVTAASYSGTYFYSWGMENVSVLSSFRLQNLKTGGVDKVTREKPAINTNVQGKHTVCFLFSDGDNFQYIGENNITSSILYASPARTPEVSVSSGMSGVVVELMPLMLLAHYDYLYPTESLVLALSSIGYTYPSKWKDEEAFEEVVNAAIHAMEVADIHTIELMDDIAFMNAVDINCTFDSMKNYFDMYTAHDVVDGCFFISYQSCYDGFSGEVCWSNDKPVISAKYCLWNPEAGDSVTNNFDYIARCINESSRNVKDENAYSFVIVHAWSGLDANGDFVGGGDCMAAVNKLASMLDDDVDIVSADEFVARMKANVVR